MTRNKTANNTKLVEWSGGKRTKKKVGRTQISLRKKKQNKKTRTQNRMKWDLPILTMRMPSSCSKNFRATETFSSFCERKVGFLVCLGNFFPDKTSTSAINLSPSDKSVSKLPMNLSTVFKCSLAHRVNVFCWMRFHWASSARSRSVATMTWSSSALLCCWLPVPSCCWSCCCCCWWWCCCCNWLMTDETTCSAGLSRAKLTSPPCWLMV